MFNARSIALAGSALIAIVVALYQLQSGTTGLSVVRDAVNGTPVTVFRPSIGSPGPAVVVAHGFAGSQQLMQPFAVTLARSGFTAVTFDFLGHGRNPSALTGSITEETGATNALVAQTIEVSAYARTLGGAEQRLALLGHSMASDIVVRAASAMADVRATVAVSMFSPAVTATSPPNLLVIVGALEPAVLKDEARRVVAMALGGPPDERLTYGDFSNGTARRYAFAAGVEHISVLYSPDALREARGWLKAAFELSSDATNVTVDARGTWIAVLFVGLIALARPLSRLLPVASPVPAGAAMTGRSFAAVAIGPALLTPLILWKAPTEFLPMLVADYLAAHFAVYGLLTVAGLLLLGRSSVRWPRASSAIAIAVAASAIAAYSIGVVGMAVDAYVANFTPTPQRLPLIAAMLAGMLPYFLADEWLTRGANAPRGAYAATKLCFLISLAIAVALNLEKLFFLIILVPAILIFFVVYGLFSGWAYGRVQHPFAGAIANAVSFAWAIAVTFPVLAR